MTLPNGQDTRHSLITHGTPPGTRYPPASYSAVACEPCRQSLLWQNQHNIPVQIATATLTDQPCEFCGTDSQGVYHVRVTA